MNIPRGISGRELASRLRKLGYNVTREKGSHMRLTTELHGQHHISIPDHHSLKLGTEMRILKDVADHHGLSVDELLEKLGF